MREPFIKARSTVVGIADSLKIQLSHLLAGATWYYHHLHENDLSQVSNKNIYLWIFFSEPSSFSQLYANEVCDLNSIKPIEPV